MNKLLQFSFPFCTFRSDQSQQNDDEAVAEKQATETDLAHIQYIYFSTLQKP
jgi:hypothetical protein